MFKTMLRPNKRKYTVPFSACKIKNNSPDPSHYFLLQAGFTSGFTYLTGGVFLSGLALLMGAGDVLLSYLSVIINICGVLILAFSSFLERFASRRVAVCLTVLSRALTVFIVLIPVLVPVNLRLIFFVPAVILAFTLLAQTTVVLNQWMLSFMDENRSGRYISQRQTLTLIVTVILSLASGWWMDYMQGGYTGIALIFSAAALLGICEILLLIRIPDSPKTASAKHRFRLRDAVLLPLKDRHFRSFVLYIFLFYLFLYISDSFTMVYMMKYLALPYRTVNALYLIISLPQIFLLNIWGKISDKHGHRFALNASVWLFAGETFFMFFASSQNWYLFIPAAFFAASIANAGFTIAVFNRRYQLIPEENRILYDNFYTAVIGLGFILGPMIGGFLKSILESSFLQTNSANFPSIRILYLLSTSGILLLQSGYLLLQRKNRYKKSCSTAHCLISRP